LVVGPSDQGTYLPGLLAVVPGGVAPHIAIEKIESGAE
jgi:hypothetical protein